MVVIHIATACAMIIEKCKDSGTKIGCHVFTISPKSFSLERGPETYYVSLSSDRSFNDEAQQAGQLTPFGPAQNWRRIIFPFR